MMDQIILSGFGGQGVMFIGKILAYAAMAGDLQVCWIPSYGPEMRGGTANCSVIISDEEINSPVLEQTDAAIVLNQPSYEKFLPRIKPGGLLVVNSSIVQNNKVRDDIKMIAIPATAIANELGNSSLANMVCLGALMPNLKLIDMKILHKAMETVVGTKKPELYEVNMQAIQKGMEW